MSKEKQVVVLIMDADSGKPIELCTDGMGGEVHIYSHNGKKLMAFWSDQLAKALKCIEERQE